MTSSKLGLLCAFTVAAALTAVTPAAGAVLNVDTTTDDASLTGCDDATANDCSLRGAIIKANGLAEASTIIVPVGTYVLSQATSCLFRSHQFGSASLNTVSLCIDAELTLVGAGAGDTIIDGNFADHVVMVSDRSVEIRGVTVRNGSAPNVSSFLGNLAGGGGINNGGTLRLVDCEVSGNTALGTGGGIFNGHSLTVLRSTIADNIAGQSGGGIENSSYLEVTTLEVQNSSVTANHAATGQGGGVENFGGVAVVGGSTISGNEAPVALGGGIYNANGTGVLTLANSTVSGNRSGSLGGGIFNAQNSRAYLDNVTVTNNFSGNDGGGIYNNVGTLSIANTLIAGNHDVFNSDPDCRGPFISRGHNLIQNATNCPSSGDTTGNVTGQDPRLGALADNGGPTRTHGLLDGSPAIDAGSADVPGTGGAACTALDQRGFLRPLGGACDIGAFERGGAFSVAKIQPGSSGNTGTVSVLVTGNGFLQGATLKLSRVGQSDIVASVVQPDAGGSAIAAAFDLAGRPAGSWDVVVVNPDSTSRTLSAGFTIEEGGTPDLWADVVGLIRREGPSTLTILYGNRGKVDALAVPLSISAPAGYALKTLFAITQPPPQADQVLTDFAQVPLTVQAGAQERYDTIPLLLPIVPAGFTGTLQITLSVPPDAVPDALSVAIDTPYLTPALNPEALNHLVAGAVAYAPGAFHVTIPSSVVPVLEQYVRNQLQLVVDNGRMALVVSLGEAQQVFSLPQLQIDAAILGALRTLQP